MKHSSHQRNRKINRVYGSTLLLTLLSQTGASLFTGQDTLVTSVMCVLHIAIWVIQTKCRSCKRKKKLVSMHVPGTKLEGSLVQLVQILRFEG